MHLTLPESVHPNARGPGWVVLSAAGHAAMVVLLFATHTTLPGPAIRAPVLDLPGSEIGPPSHFGNPGISPAASLPSDRVFDASAVDRAVEPIRGNPTPRYPPALASAGFEGSVTVRFVVDTLGTVERASVTVVHTSHALLEQSVREALIHMRFLPAEARGRKVRQLVEQSFQFAIRR
jgi:TonB family protein